MFPGFDKWFGCDAVIFEMRSMDVAAMFKRCIGPEGKLLEIFHEFKERLLLSVTQILQFSPRCAKVQSATQLGTEMQADGVYRSFVLKWVEFVRSTKQADEVTEILTLLRGDLWGRWGNEGNLIHDELDTERRTWAVSMLAARGKWDPMGTGFTLDSSQFKSIRTRFDDALVQIAIGTQSSRANGAMDMSRDLREDTIYAMYATEFVYVIIQAAEKDTLATAGIDIDKTTVVVLRSILKGLESNAELQYLECESERRLRGLRGSGAAGSGRDNATHVFTCVEDIPDGAGYFTFFTLVMQKITQCTTVADR